MSDWEEYTLFDLCTNVSYGYTASAKHEDIGIKFLRITDIAQNRLSWDNVPYCEINDANLKKFRLYPGDIVIARTGATTGANYTMKEKDPKDVIFASYLIRYEVKRNLANPFYIGHILRSSQWKDFVDAISGGSAQPGANAKQLGSFEILLPPLPEQRAIAEVLSSLDDKIDLLHRQNQTLEKIAETLFRKWFVEDASEEWEAGTLEEEFDITMGQSPPGSSYNENGDGSPMYQGNKDFGFRFPVNRVFTTEPKRIAKKHDTLISVRAPVGEQNMASENCCIGRGVAAFRYKKDSSFYTYTYYKMKSLMDEIKAYNNEGTVFGSISKKDFQRLEVLIPPDNYISEYQGIAKPLDEKIFNNSIQIEGLKKLRDGLLPKLMNGEVKVNT